MSTAVSFARGSGLDTTSAYRPTDFASAWAIARPLDESAPLVARSARSAWRRISRTPTGAETRAGPTRA